MTLACMLLLVVFVGLQYADCELTSQGLDAGLDEKNPIARWLMDRYGRWPAMIGVKTVIVLVVAVACYFMPYSDYALAAICDLAYVYIVGRNYQLVRDAEG